MPTYTVKVGTLGPWVHTAHILLSTLTIGCWLPAYGIHALIHQLSKPTMTIEVPDGHRVEWRNGYPNVLGPDEWLEPRTTREQALRIAGYASPLLIAAAMIGGAYLRTS